MPGADANTDANAFYWGRLRVPIALTVVFTVLLCLKLFLWGEDWLIASDPHIADAVIYAKSPYGHAAALYRYQVGADHYGGTTYGPIGQHFRVYYSAAFPSMSSMEPPNPEGKTVDIAIVLAIDLCLGSWLLYWARAPVVGVKGLLGSAPGVVLDHDTSRAVAALLTTVADAPPPTMAQPVREARYLLTVMPSGFTYHADERGVWRTWEPLLTVDWTAIGDDLAAVRTALARC